MLLISNLSRNITGIVYCCCCCFFRCFFSRICHFDFSLSVFQRVFSSRLVSVLMSGSSRRHFGHVVNYIYCISQCDSHTQVHTQRASWQLSLTQCFHFHFRVHFQIFHMCILWHLWQGWLLFICDTLECLCAWGVMYIYEMYRDLYPSSL